MHNLVNADAVELGLVKYDRQPLRFSFTFYKAKDVWQLYNFEYIDRLIEELDESSKVYRLKENFDFLTYGTELVDRCPFFYRVFLFNPMLLFVL